jgi:putative transcriptional regulator
MKGELKSILDIVRHWRTIKDGIYITGKSQKTEFSCWWCMQKPKKQTLTRSKQLRLRRWQRRSNVMDKELFADLMQSMKEAVDIAKGELPPSRMFTVAPPDVKQVREKTGLSQSAFAQMIGVKVKTLQNWEQHRRQPTGAAAALLTIFDRAPDVAIKALHAAPGDQVR